MRALFNFLLLIAIGTLTYLCIVSVVDPIHFNRERGSRSNSNQEIRKYPQSRNRLSQPIRALYGQCRFAYLVYQIRQVAGY